jgi:hypothetical protein
MKSPHLFKTMPFLLISSPSGEDELQARMKEQRENYYKPRAEPPDCKFRHKAINQAGNNTEPLRQSKLTPALRRDSNRPLQTPHRSSELDKF